MLFEQNKVGAVAKCAFCTNLSSHTSDRCHWCGNSFPLCSLEVSALLKRYGLPLSAPCQIKDLEAYLSVSTGLAMTRLCILAIMLQPLCFPFRGFWLCFSLSSSESQQYFLSAFLTISAHCFTVPISSSQRFSRGALTPPAFAPPLRRMISLITAYILPRQEHIL